MKLYVFVRAYCAMYIKQAILMDRLVLLFPKINVDPADGYITENELTEWNMQQAEREVLHRTQRELETHDKNNDGFVAFTEYEPPSWVRNSG